MERVAFLIEEGGEQLDCLLNPETLVMRRLAGLQPRRAASGTLTGRGLTDDPMLFTGGGRTELTLDLLFDVTLAGLSTPTDDVRSRTRPLWDLAENRSTGSSQRRPSRVRLIWGKSWNIPCVVLAVAERLEYFTEGGTPRRSWLRLRLLRVEDERRDRTERIPSTASLPSEERVLAAPQAGAHSIIGGAPALALPETVDLAPLPEIDITISESIVTAADLFADAFTATPAGRLLLDVQSAIGDSIQSAAESFEQGVADLINAIGDSDFVQGLKIAFDAVAVELEIAGTAIGNALASAKMGLIEVTLDAVGAISVAVRTVEATISQIAREIGEEIDATIFEPIRAALEPYRPLLDAMMASVAIVGHAVKAQAARMAAVTMQTLEAGAKSAAEFLEALNSGDISIASEIRAVVTPALNAIERVATSIRETGQTLILEDLPEMMERIGSGIVRLREAGENALAEQLEKSAESLALGIKGLNSVANVREEVGHGKSTGRATESLREIETNLDAIGGEAEGGIIAKHQVILESLTIIQNSTIIIQQSEQKLIVSAIPAEIEQIETIVKQAIRDEKPLTSAQKAEIRNGVKKIGKTTEEVLRHEQESNASAILAAITDAETESESPSGPVPEGTQQTADEQAMGERLDQLAFQYFGDPAAWRLLALYNRIDNPLKLPTGLVLRLPSSDGI